MKPNIISTESKTSNLKNTCPITIKPTLEQIKPLAVVHFAGRVNPEQMDTADWLINPKLRHIYMGYRDWNAIKDWGASISNTPIQRSINC